jgi:hypothetical protein
VAWMEWAGDAGDLGDRRRLAWGKDQRQDRRYRRGHQARQKALSAPSMASCFSELQAYRAPDEQDPFRKSSGTSARLVLEE